MSEKEKNELTHLYQDWFLDYASYVVLDRAIPALEDGLKPVQRRILHSMKEIDDGRLHKAANIIGHTMKYHPHGDMAIGDALVKLAQKGLLIETQGNWGHTLTGDGAAAPRYIEARLSALAKEVLFHDELTEWQDSYDGRGSEPLFLPTLFPLLLFQGAEGIAVGMTTKILPHNFCEIIHELIKALREEKTELYPDFPSGGLIDVSNYQDGKRGGKVRVRAKIEIIQACTLKIQEIPYGTTTSSIIESILSANEKGSLKIKNIEDNTAENIDIRIHFPAETNLEDSIKALYAFTDCEVVLSPCCCVIYEEKPKFLGITEVLSDFSIFLKKRLEGILNHKNSLLKEKIRKANLEQIFIERKLYTFWEQAKDDEAMSSFLKKELSDWSLTEEEIRHLGDLKFKKISQFNIQKQNESLIQWQKECCSIEENLKNLTRYAITYLKNLKTRYGEPWKIRKSQIVSIDKVKASDVALINLKLYLNKTEGFLGTSLKKEEMILECSSLDEILVIKKDGNYVIMRAPEKIYIGENPCHISIFDKKSKNELEFFIIYEALGKLYAKRVCLGASIKDRHYPLAPQIETVHYFSMEKKQVDLTLKDAFGKNKIWPLDLGTLSLKKPAGLGRGLTQATFISCKERTVVQEKDLWLDREALALSLSPKGIYLGSFLPKDSLMRVNRKGVIFRQAWKEGYTFEERPLFLRKWQDGLIFVLLYHDQELGSLFLKKIKIFQPGPTLASNQTLCLGTFKKDSRFQITFFYQEELILEAKDYPLPESEAEKIWKVADSKPKSILCLS